MFCLSLEKKIKKIKKSLLKSAKKDPLFTLFVILMAFLAIFFRYYNYFDRIYVHSDNALFVQAAKFAQHNLIIPQIGPFAQVPFFTGPWWLWILSIFFFVPLGLLTPWYIMSFLSLVFILLIYWLGKEIGGKWMGAAAALFAAISPAQIDNSFSVWNAAADPFLALLAMIFLIRFYKQKRPLDIFLLTFIISLAITIHFQNALIGPLVLIAILTSKPKIKNFAYMVIGLLIPILPFLYFDLRFNWFETRRIFDYITIGQYRIWVPNRWLTYAGVYWPKTWAYIVGGNIWVGGLIITLLSLLFIFRLKDMKKYKLFYLIAIGFVLGVILFRYWRGERFAYFSHFAHPAVILLTAWVAVELYRIRKIIGLIFVSLLIIFTFNESLKNLKDRELTLFRVNLLKNEIYANYPQDKFETYGCIYNGALISHPLSFVMYSEGRNEIGGVKIGVCQLADKSFDWKALSGEDVKGENSAWLNETTSTVYKSMTEWWKENPPR